MPLPSDFDILRCFVSRAVPCRYTRVERRVAHERVARHDHPRDPEEEDLRRGDEHVGRIERAQVGGLLVRPAERRDRPEPATRTRCRARPRPARTGPPQCGQLVEILAADDDVLRRIAVVAVPHRDAMSPPELPRDVPVADVRQPVARTPPSHRSGRMRMRPVAHGLRAPARRAAPSSRTTDRDSRGSTTVSQR